MSREITIIGAGSTGLSAGVFFESNGYKPRIIEKRDRAKISKAIGINPVTLQLLEKSGITKQFINNGWKLNVMNFWYNDDLIYKTQFSKVKHPYPYMIIQPQFETEQIIENYLNEKGIAVERNIELLKISKKDESLKLDFKNINEDLNFSIETNGIVIGADGNKSKVREEIGVEFEGWEHPTEYIFYDIELETSISSKEGHYRFNKNGAMLMLHIRDGVWRVGGNLKDVLNYLPKGTKTGKIHWQSNFTIAEKIAKNYSVGNIYLVGDAAHIHSPIGGKGMNMCIEDSFIFSELFKQNREEEFSAIRRKRVKKTVGVLGQLTEAVGGQHFIGRTMRGSMKPFSFLFPVFMPYMRNFLLGLK